MALAQIVIQTVMKLASTDRFIQIDARRSHQTYIHRVRLLGTHAGNFAVFQGGEELGLNR
ncbi:hypothetical protein D3C77_721370 [compost metagenome]